MKRVLIVEDSPTQAEQLRLILDEGGFEVTVATDAEAALRLFRADAFDVVISDIIMPGLSGYELCHRLKHSPGGQAVPVILLTSLNDPMDIIRGLECGADNFITKPYAPDQLLGRILGVLENREVRSKGKLAIDVEIVFLGKKFVISSEKEQILDLLIATFEDIIRTNRGLQESRAELARAKVEVEKYASDLERRVQERTSELAEQRGQLARAQAIAHLGNWRLIVDTGRIEWSEEMYRIFGVEAAGFSHTLYEMIGMVHPADRDELAGLLERSIAQRTSYRHEFRIVRPSGEERQCWIEGHCQFSEHDEVVALFGAWQDITERKLMQQQLHQAQKMEAVGQLTGGIAHDFNNILTIVIGNSELLTKSLADQPQLAALAKMVDEAAERGADLTRHLLAFARKQPLQPRGTDVNALITQASKLLRPTLGEQIQIQPSLAADVWPALVDGNWLATALLNLAINARDAMPDGGKLILESGNAHLDEAYARLNDIEAGHYVMIAVSDTGSGIPQAIRDKVFEPFFTTKGAGKGTGLGLSMVYGFVKQSGGHIKLYSEEGHGTTIRIYLPKAAAHDAQSDMASTRVEGGRETIVVVEDDHGVRNHVVAQLRGLGYRTLTASDAGGALALIESGAEIDLLFTDVIMPGAMNGPQLAERALKHRPGLKVLYTSGYTESAMVHSGRLDPGVLLLAKPYRTAELARMVRKALSVRQVFHA